MEILLAADEADAGHTVAALVHSLLGCRNQAGIVGQAEVIVGAEIQGLAAVSQGDFGPLGRANRAFAFVETGLVDGLKLLLEMLLEFSVHK